MTTTATCPQCGAALPPEAPAGLCPRCLLEAGLAPDSAQESSATTDWPNQPESLKPSAPAETMEQPGSVIAGRYKLLEQIGEGGFGIVFMAEQQEPVRRKVALKIIKPGMDSRQVIARFQAERQALALMDHPHIARVFDAGTTPSGRPYFVMELVKGIPITDYCDRHKLSLRQRLELFVQVCQAVQHAHQKGIIHRDLKPSNVLVCLYDGVPSVKVIDFGVAKAIEQRLTQQTLFTQFGQIVGTWEYMSPEQAEFNQLDVDTRSDVYSLGVLLYELLTGTTPLTRERVRQAAVMEVLRLIREEEPERPSTRLSHSEKALARLSAQRQMEGGALVAALRRELDWVVLKALEKDRTRRYATASDLDRDVERYLRDEPVEACPPSLGYRLRKVVRRYRGVLAAAAAMVLLLVAGVVVSTWQAVRATKAEAMATREVAAARQAEEQTQQEAERAWKAEQQAREKEQSEVEARRKAQQEAARAEREKARAEEQLRRAELLVYVGKLSLAQNAFAEGYGDLAVRYLEECQWNLRDWEHRHLWTRFNSKQTLWGHTGEVTSVAFSPDGRRIVAWDATGKLLAWSSETGQPVEPIDPPAFPDSKETRFLDGFRRVFTLGNENVYVADSRLAHWNAWPLPDAAERRRYHREKAQECEAKGQWFAAAFHLRRLLLGDPNNAELKRRLEQALKKHAGH